MRKEEYKGFTLSYKDNYINITRDGQYITRIFCMSFHNGHKSAKSKIDELIKK